jgi:precorrin-3B synthase
MVRSTATDPGLGSSPWVRGWCPTLFEPMVAADGLLANVKPRARGWTAGDLRAIAAAGALHGSGRFLLTNRGNLQVRGLSAAGAAALAETMVAAGLASASPQAERRRSILMAPPYTRAAQSIGARLEAWLESAVPETLGVLPSKFCFSVTSEDAHGDCATADICIHAGERHGWVAACAGDIAALTDDPVAAVAAITGAFLRMAAARPGRPRRLKDLVAEQGATALFAAAGLEATPFPPARPAAAHAGLAARAPARVGTLGGEEFGLGIPFGRADVATLNAVADIAERFANGRLRPTVHRTFNLSGTPPDRLADLSAAAEGAGMIVACDDPRLRVAACSGGSGCARTVVDIVDTAKTLAPLWRGKGMLHVSGCAKGCAHPESAAVTLVAGPAADQFNVLHDSRADGAASRSITLAEVREELTRGADRGCP